jgi:hypothetical protein
LRPPLLVFRLRICWFFFCKLPVIVRSINSYICSYLKSGAARSTFRIPCPSNYRSIYIKALWNLRTYSYSEHRGDLRISWCRSQQDLLP